MRFDSVATEHRIEVAEMWITFSNVKFSVAVFGWKMLRFWEVWGESSN